MTLSREWYIGEKLQAGCSHNSMASTSFLPGSYASPGRKWLKTGTEWKSEMGWDGRASEKGCDYVTLRRDSGKKMLLWAPSQTSEWLIAEVGIAAWIALSRGGKLTPAEFFLSIPLHNLHKRNDAIFCCLLKLELQFGSQAVASTFHFLKILEWNVKGGNHPHLNVF